MRPHLCIIAHNIKELFEISNLIIVHNLAMQKSNKNKNVLSWMNNGNLIESDFGLSFGLFYRFSSRSFIVWWLNRRENRLFSLNNIIKRSGREREREKVFHLRGGVMKWNDEANHQIELNLRKLINTIQNITARWRKGAVLCVCLSLIHKLYRNISQQAIQFSLDSPLKMEQFISLAPPPLQVPFNKLFVT